MVAKSAHCCRKYEEIYPPEVGEFVYITDDTYTKKQVLRMEHLILKVLSFDVAVPTINCFCERFLRDISADDTTKALTWVRTLSLSRDYLSLTSCSSHLGTYTADKYDSVPKCSEVQIGSE